MNVRDWFWAWLAFHKTVNAHAKFRDYEAAGLEVIYGGWIGAFERNEIERKDADEASRQMQALDKRELFPEHHLAKLLELATKKIRSGHNLAEEERVQAETRRQKQEEKYQETIRRAWAEIDEPTRNEFRCYVRANHPPALCRFDDYVEFMARNRWADLVRANHRARVPA